MVKPESFALQRSETAGNLARERRASYVGFVRENDEGRIEVFLAWEREHNTQNGIIPEHWAFPGGGSLTVPHLRLIRREKFPFVLPQREGKLEHPTRTARREVKQEIGENVGRNAFNPAIVVITPDFTQTVNQARDGGNESPQERQETIVYALPRKKEVKPGKNAEVQRGGWFTLDKAIHEAVEGKILDANLLLGIQAVIEWYLIHEKGLVPNDPEFLKNISVTLEGKLRSDFSIYGANQALDASDAFLKKMRAEIEQRRKQRIVTQST